MTTNLTGWFWGYDPGGHKGNGVAAICSVDGELQKDKTLIRTKDTAAEVVTWFKDQDTPRRRDRHSHPLEWRERRLANGRPRAPQRLRRQEQRDVAERSHGSDEPERHVRAPATSAILPEPVHHGDSSESPPRGHDRKALQDALGRQRSLERGRQTHERVDEPRGVSLGQRQGAELARAVEVVHLSEGATTQESARSGRTDLRVCSLSVLLGLQEDRLWMAAQSVLRQGSG